MDLGNPLWIDLDFRVFLVDPALDELGILLKCAMKRLLRTASQLLEKRRNMQDVDIVRALPLIVVAVAMLYPAPQLYIALGLDF